jgi:hypothetical protein
VKPRGAAEPQQSAQKSMEEERASQRIMAPAGSQVQQMANYALRRRSEIIG